MHIQCSVYRLAPLRLKPVACCGRQVSKAILGEKKPLTTRPSAALPPADFAGVKSTLAEGKCGKVLGDVTEELVISHLLYPKARQNNK